LTDLVARLRAIVGEANVIVDERLEDYEHDGTFLQHALHAAVLPATTEEVAEVVKACAETRTPVTSRGAGSGLVGGPVPLSGGVVLSLERFTELEIDSANLMAVAGAGVINGDLDEMDFTEGIACVTLALEVDFKEALEVYEEARG